MTPTADPQSTVSARALSRTYGTNRAVREVSLQLHRGEVLGLLGPNGAGKTTTMQMLTGNLAPTSGEVDICGIDLIDQPTQAKARIGYLPEVPPLYRELKVDEYLRMAGRLHKVKKGDLAQALSKARSRCGLADMGQRLIGSLSKGYQQRVGIAQAIIHEPDVIILDEPTVGLDPNQIREIRALIKELGRDHSLILSTHILPEVEAVCDRVQILHRGEVVFNDTIAALKQFRGGQALQIGLRNPPAMEDISRTAGGATVDALGGNLFRVVPRDGADPTDSLVRASVERQWGLFQLQPAQASLEEVFVQLTHREEETEEGASA
ncbi:MAG TPA: ATP-binding cassette domain-containing protein [Burkholderiales bacterium]|nr:ATP-binding cassette domain-containing protein [Burkholderiales bacterium]